MFKHSTPGLETEYVPEHSVRQAEALVKALVRKLGSSLITFENELVLPENMHGEFGEVAELVEIKPDNQRYPRITVVGQEIEALGDDTRLKRTYRLFHRSYFGNVDAFRVPTELCLGTQRMVGGQSKGSYELSPARPPDGPGHIDNYYDIVEQVIKIGK